jgi:transcriptional regulatory protein RtcR
MRRIGLGFLGVVLDAHGGSSERRKKAWRPTVSLAMDTNLKLDQIELWAPPNALALAKNLKSDVESASEVDLRIHQAAIKDPWNFEEMYSYLFDFAKSYNFDTSKEEYFVHLTTGTHVAQICLFLLTESRHIPAKLVQTAPRREGNTNAESGVTIIDLDLSRYDSIAKRFSEKLSSDLEVLKAGIQTKNAAFNKTISEIELVSRSSREPILLLGPTGSGKSHLAKQIFELKKRQHQLQGNFVDINCATIRGDQAMSTLFGHVKGAFTGAGTSRAGVLLSANKGLLFLDEIGELGLDEQAMLLRAIEDKSFFPLGSDKAALSDFELIAGTNRDLTELVQQGRFRDDLLHRINVWSFALPALKERKEDIAPNLDFELRKFEERSNQRVTFNQEAKQLYLQFAESSEAVWSGNFRDLNSSVIRMATLSSQGRITEEIVQVEITRLNKSWSNGTQAQTNDHDRDLLSRLGVRPNEVDLFDLSQLTTVLKTIKTCKSLASAGRVLFACTRKNRRSINDSDRIRKYLARFGISSEKIRGLL